MGMTQVRRLAGLVSVSLLMVGLQSPAAAVDRVAWSGSVSLAVAKDTVDVHDPYARVTATISPAVDNRIHLPTRVGIYDSTGARVGWCDGFLSPCSDLKVSKSVPVNGTLTFTAFAAPTTPTSPPVTDVRATSNTVSVTNTGWAGTVTLRVSRDQVDVHNTNATVTATTSVALRPPYKLTIYDADTGRQVGWCEGVSTSSCYDTNKATLSKTISVGEANATRRFVAYVAQDYPSNTLPTNDVRATSNTVSVTNTGWAGKVTLTRSAANPDSYVWFTAETKPALAGPYYLSIYDSSGQLVRRCGPGYPCSGTATTTTMSAAVPKDGVNATRTFVAYVARDFPTSGVPTNDVRAISGYLTTTGDGAIRPGELDGGYNPSEACTTGCAGDPINTATGEFWETTTDLEIPGPSGGLAVRRSFATARTDIDGPFGYGWSWQFGMQLAIANGATGTTLDTASQLRLIQENGSALVFTRGTDGTYSAPPRTFATLSRSADGSFTFTRGKTQIYRFDSTGALTRAEDLNGQGITLDRDTAGRIVTATDERGRALTVSWSSSRVAAVSDSTGRTVAYQYSPAGDLTAVTNVDGTTRAYAYDTKHRVVSMTAPDGGVTTNTYDGASRVIAQTDPLGRVLHLAYGTGQTTITSPTGAVTIERYVDLRLISKTQGAGTAQEATTYFTYSTTNQVESSTDPLGRMTRFTYDAFGNRTSVTDPLGRTSTTTYDAFNNPLVVMNAAGESTTFAYDERGNLLSMTDATGAVTAFTVNQDGTVATATDPLGRVTSYAYDAHGFVSSVTGPDGAVVTTVHDTLGRLTATTDPRGTAPGADGDGFTSTFTYDAAGRRLTVTDPVGAVVASAYDTAGRPVSMTDVAGATTTSEYDLAGQVTAVVDAAGARTTFTYDGAGRVTSMTDPSGATTTTVYDHLGRLTGVTDALGRVSRSEYDAGNRVIATVTPSGARTTYTYDAADQLLTVTDPLGKVTSTTYDLAGRPVTVTDADGRAVTTSYDRAGRPVKVLRADGSALRWEYDATGKITATSDAAGARTTYTYDAAGRRATATDTAGRTTAFGYDTAGLLTTLTQADGAVTTYTHDAAGRRTGTDYSDATPDVSTVYDLAGRPTSVTDGTGTTTYAYDVLGQVVEVANGATSVGYGWDALGRLTELTYPSGQAVQREYDAAGQLTTVTDWADREYTYTYDADGLTEQIAYPNGVTTDLDRDDNGQTLAITLTGNGIDLLELAYGYTDAGLLTDQGTTRSTESRAPPTIPSTSSTYAWDDLARISQITGDHAGTFDFDAAGSVTALADGRTLAYDAGRQLTALVTPPTTPGDTPVTTSYTYDGRGNRASATTDTGPAAGAVAHTYDQANQLASITGVEGTTTTYTYAATGLRATATTGGTTEHYTWDTLAGIPLLLTDHTHAYLYGNGSVPLAQIDLADGTVDYLHTDTLGSVRSTTNAVGAVTSDADYDTYGRPLAVTDAPNWRVTRFGYGGEYADPTGYLYLRARYYDPTTAQFLTRDPLEATTGNPYGYTDGNPLQYTDPLGLDWLQNLSDFSAGFGDTVSFGFSKYARETWFGVSDGTVKFCSTAYTSGKAGGIAADVALALTGLGAVKGGIKGALQISSRSTWAPALPKPTVSAERLKNIVDNLYKGITNPNRVGNGTTMDAVRHELATGATTHGRKHIIKLQDSLNGLEKWLERNLDGAYQDRLVARSLADEIKQLLGG